MKATANLNPRLTDRADAPVTAEARLRRVHDLHSAPLFRFLLRLTLGERFLAEDLLQETMVRAWRHIDLLNADAEAQRRWLFTVARRVAVDAARARQVRPAEVGSIDLTQVPMDCDSAEGVVTVQLVRDALPKLSPHHRVVLVAIYFRGMSTGEIAEHIGIPEGTVKSRAHYALRALRAVIGSMDDAA